MSQLPPPPVPQALREMLKDYPEHIQELQKSLNRVITKPSKSTPAFEVAIWELEGTLGTFISEAREELKAAEASGDSEAIARAEEKERLMERASSRNIGMKGLHELWGYFETRKEAFK
jgi:hypothetical protein